MDWRPAATTLATGTPAATAATAAALAANPASSSRRVSAAGRPQTAVAVDVKGVAGDSANGIKRDNVTLNDAPVGGLRPARSPGAVLPGMDTEVAHEIGACQQARMCPGGAHLPLAGAGSDSRHRRPQPQLGHNGGALEKGDFSSALDGSLPADQVIGGNKRELRQCRGQVIRRRPWQQVTADHTEPAQPRQAAQRLDHTADHVRGRADIVYRYQRAVDGRMIDYQQRRAIYRQQQRSMAGAAPTGQKWRGRKGREMVGEIGQVARTLIEGSPQDEQRIVPAGRRHPAGPFQAADNLRATNGQTRRTERLTVYQWFCLRCGVYLTPGGSRAKGKHER